MNMSSYKDTHQCHFFLLFHSSSSSSVLGNQLPVGRQRNTFWPLSRTTSTSTLIPQGHWWCRQWREAQYKREGGATLICKRQHSLRWTQLRRFLKYLLWYNSWERLLCHLCFYTQTCWISTNQRLNTFFIFFYLLSRIWVLFLYIYIYSIYISISMYRYRYI